MTQYSMYKAYMTLGQFASACFVILFVKYTINSPSCHNSFSF
ncbi:hypothetical protein AO385_1202 [Moraxella catarrhalis]|nr:hypothetical protein AO385_1202 [Moraxella catarrhalis]